MNVKSKQRINDEYAKLVQYYLVDYGSDDRHIYGCGDKKNLVIDTQGIRPCTQSPYYATGNRRIAK
jgi:hypothetical protein